VCERERERAFCSADRFPRTAMGETLGKLFVDPTTLPGGANCFYNDTLADGKLVHTDPLHCDQGSPTGPARAPKRSPLPLLNRAWWIGMMVWDWMGDDGVGLDGG
jgi:hypothetical protein